MNAKRLEPSLDKKTYDDYLAFFTTEEGIDILPYLYKDSGNFYDSAITHPDYYVFRDEVEIINKNTKILTHYLKDIKNIIEIGPGSYKAIENKTLPILRSAPNLENYYALDISENFLQQTCNFINKNANVKTHFKAADLLEPGLLNLENLDQTKNAAILLGITLGNLNIAQQNSFLQKINSILNTNDIFIVSADTNSDDKSIIKAYEHKNFQLSFLDSIAEFNHHFKDHTNSFEVMYEFIPSETTLHIYYKARKKLTFYYPLHGNIEVQEGQKLRGIKSKKFHHKEFQTLLESSGFKILEIINNSDKIKLFICKKI